ncbi:ribosome silencing factor [Atopococcus tabaci]|uniref:ribosome silencing factor n=1 Tax=Atopococcus tabaci TaxID=269774 RepID=UPI0004073799|nr:ribosome silencing factor [Atopococcus tabaci]
MEATPEKVLEMVVKSADDKRAEDIMAMDMKGISVLADYFVVMHGNNERQIGAIADGILDESEKMGAVVKRVEGKDSANWILIDLGDVIVHVFSQEEREFYNLEKLWSDAENVDLSSMIEL